MGSGEGHALEVGRCEVQVRSAPARPADAEDRLQSKHLHPVVAEVDDDDESIR